MAVKTEKVENTSESTRTEASQPDPALEIAALRGEVLQLRRAYNTLDTNFKRSQKKIADYEAQIPKRPAGRPPKDHAASQEQASGTATTIATDAEPIIDTPIVASDDTHVKADEHFTEWQPRYCPECGTSNSQFKDEAVCNDCGIHLGSMDYAQKVMKACPNCGGRQVKRA